METGTYQPSGIIDADPTTATVSAAEQKKLEKAEEKYCVKTGEKGVIIITVM